MAKRRWSRKLVVAEIQRLSKDGVSPSPHIYKDLYHAALYHFDSWATACEVAGVATRRQAGIKERAKLAPPRLTLTPAENRRNLAVLLALAIRGGIPLKEAVSCSIEAYHNGNVPLMSWEGGNVLVRVD